MSGVNFLSAQQLLLGGPRGLEFYMQRVALEGSRPVIERIAGLATGS